MSLSRTGTSDSFSSFLSSSIRTQSYTGVGVRFQDKEPLAKPVDVCPVIRLSENDEEILIVQNLKTRIEPNHDISEAVNRAIAKYTERVDRQIETVENEFKSINDEIEHRILNASQKLDESLYAIDNTLAGLLDDRKSAEFTRFDSLQKCFVDVNDLINERNKNIESFMGELHDLEKERTALIKDCYQHYMLDVKQLSVDSFERLYNKYLKNYNTIKLGNFRTYEDLRYKLVQWSGILQQDFVLRACDVKTKIKKNIGESFKNKFIAETHANISHKIEYAQLIVIRFLNNLNGLFNELMRRLEKHNNLDTAFVLECSDSLKIRSKKIDEIIENTMLFQIETLEEIQLILTKTVAEFDNTTIESDELFSPSESTAINSAMVAEAINLQQEKMKKTLQVQLLLSDVKNAINKICAMLNPAMEIIYRRSERLMKARNIVLVALDTKFQTNDSELNILENSFNVELDALVQATDETEVRKCEYHCINTLINIKDRVQVNRTLEMEIISDYIGLIATEFDVFKLECQIIIKLFPESLKPLPKFNDTTQNERWSTSVKTSIASFETTANNFQYTLYERLRAFIQEFKSVDIMNNELVWTSLLKHCIYERFNVAEHLLKLRTIGVQEGIAKKRIDEIKQHENLLTCHTKAALETFETLRYKSIELFEEFDLKRELILNKVEQINISALPITELTEVLNELRYKMHLLASEINDKYLSHYNNVESNHQAIENSNLELMKSIKMFPEGGNYGNKEAMNTVNALNDLSNIIGYKQTSILEELNENSYYASVNEIKETLFKLIKPIEIGLNKKVFKQKYYSINKLLNITANQEILNLEKMLDSLQTKLNVGKKTFEKNDAIEMSKCWLDLLSETKTFMEFVVESYQDVQVLIKYKTKSSIWNTKSEKVYASSNITVNSANSKLTFSRGELKFHDYCKTMMIDVSSEAVTRRPRFLSNVYSAITHYISESQNNAADMALTESADNTWIDEEPDTAFVYAEIMDEVVNNSRATALQSELIWIFKLSEFFDLSTELYAMERQFKNAVLATYHEESVTGLNEASEAFRVDTETVRKRLSADRRAFHNKLKPSHGHPRNAWRLESLMADFQRFNTECADTLSGTCDRIEMSLEKMLENYEAMCPRDVLAAATVYIKCNSKLREQLGRVDDSADVSRGSSVLTESTASVITTKHDVGLAVTNVKSHLRTNSGTVFWSENNQLWAHNVQVFSGLGRERFGDLQTFGVVEKAKMVDWATVFVRDVERVKELHSQYIII